MVVVLLAAGALLMMVAGPGGGGSPIQRVNTPPAPPPAPPPLPQSGADPAELAAIGRDAFRYDTFGNEYYYTDDLRLPFRLLLALPPSIRAKAFGVFTDSNGEVIGIQEVVGPDDQKRYGITCALCHSIPSRDGERMDGVANTALNYGALLALSPTTSLGRKSILLGWGRGRIDLTFMNEAEDRVSNPAKILPVYTQGLLRFGWNGAFDTPGETANFIVDYVTHGLGSFRPKPGWQMVDKHRETVVGTAGDLGASGNWKDIGAGGWATADPYEAALAARSGDAAVNSIPDLVGPMMPAVAAYLETLEPPRPTVENFDPVRAERGKTLFTGKAGCARCHTPPLYTNNQTITPAAVGLSDRRATAKAFNDYTYKVPQLRGVWAAGPYFHDGRAPTLYSVVTHFNRQFGLGLTQRERNDLVEYLKSLR